VAESDQRDPLIARFRNNDPEDSPIPLLHYGYFNGARPPDNISSGRCVMSRIDPDVHAIRR
jgi:hypothetical protein